MMSTRTLAFCLMGFFLLAAPCAFAQQQEDDERVFSASLYGGAMTDDNWRQSLSGQADLVDSWIVAGALAWTFYRPDNGRWSLELEANVVRHFGIQDHFEFNAPVLTGRWEYFPWDGFLDTSLAFGLGPSYATREPEYERIENGSSDQFLLFWHMEATFGLPGSRWDTFLRLHHRSTGYGMFADEGGSNILCIGLRYEF